MLPADLRIENALTVIRYLRERPSALRADVARATGLSVPAVHRQIDTLVRLRLVEEFLSDSPINVVGRPATSIRFVANSATVVGIDIGNFATRILLANATLNEIAYHEVPTDSLDTDLVSTLSRLIAQLKTTSAPNSPIVAVGIGVAATTDPETGQFTQGPLRARFQHQNLRSDLASDLGVPVVIRQDDHLSAIAEVSALGAFPGATSLAVLEIGEGIGCGFSLAGDAVSGSFGAFGRIAKWPISTALPGMPTSRTLLGATLTAPGLVHLYHRLGGDPKVVSSREIFELSSADVVADQVLTWAREEVGEILGRLATVFDPAVLVLGGGVGRAFGRDANYFSSLLNGRDFSLSELGSRAVVQGAIVSVREYLDNWLRYTITENSASRSRLGSGLTTKRKVKV